MILKDYKCTHVCAGLVTNTTYSVYVYSVETHDNKRIDMDYPVMVQRCSVCHKTDCKCLHAHTVNLPHYKMIGTHMYICMYIST